jgi:SNF family Na+-dependent transporter
MNINELNYLGWWNPTFPSQDYWNNVILNKSNDINKTGYLNWQLVVSLFSAWLLVYLMVFRGIKVSGKLAYFTSLFPYLILLILGIRGWMLDGALDGIRFYINPDFTRLYDAKIWTDAASNFFNLFFLFTYSYSYS